MKHFLQFILILCCSISAYAQYTVMGIVVDKRSREPVIGANVLVLSSSKGTQTDLEGKFSYSVEGSQSVRLVISYIGFVNQTITASPSAATFEVVLVEDVTNLEEVIVTGLASSVKRSNLANAVASISSKELLGTTTIQTTDGALYGKIPGANIRSTGGAPLFLKCII